MRVPAEGEGVADVVDVEAGLGGHGMQGAWRQKGTAG